MNLNRRDAETQREESGVEVVACSVLEWLQAATPGEVSRRWDVVEVDERDRSRFIEV